MADILKAIGPAGVLIFFCGSGLLYATAQIHQLKEDVRHLAFMKVRSTARLVEHNVLPLKVLQEDLEDLEAFLNTPETGLFSHLLKATLD